MRFKTSHFGIYALIANEDKTHIVLVEKARGPYKGLYDLPGGSPEAGETPEQTLIREVFEETGLYVLKYEKIDTVDARYEFTGDQGESVLHHMGILYRAEVDGAMKGGGDGEDSLGCSWMAIADICKVKYTPFVIAAIQSLKV